MRRGLYGALVIEPRERPARGVVDLAVVVHTLDGTPLVNSTDGVERRASRPGTPVRLRLVNTDNTPHSFDVGGTPSGCSRSTAPISTARRRSSGRTLVLAAGGRYDVGFAMPPRPVKLAVEDTLAGSR